MPRTILLYDILITVLLFVVEYSSSWWWCSGTPLGCPIWRGQKRARELGKEPLEGHQSLEREGSIPIPLFDDDNNRHRHRHRDIGTG